MARRRRRRRKKQQKLNSTLVILLLVLGVLLVGGGGLALVNPGNLWTRLVNKIVPRDPMAVMAEAKTFEEMGKYDEARAAFKQAVKHCRKDEAKGLIVRMEFAAFLQRRLEDSEDLSAEIFKEYDTERAGLLNAVMQTDPKHAEARDLLAERAWDRALQFGGGWWKEVENECTGQLKIDPDRADVYWRRAVAHQCLTSAGGTHIEDAKKDFDEATTRAPHNVSYYLDWVAFLQRPNVAAKPAEIKAVFDKALKANPESGQVLAEYARYMYLTRDPGANEQFQKAQQAAAKSNNVDDWLTVGRLHEIGSPGVKERDLDAAAAAYQKAIDADSTRYEPYQALAKLYVRRRLTDKAEALLRQSLEKLEASRGGKALADLPLDQMRRQRAALADIHADLAGLLVRAVPGEGKAGRDEALAAARESVAIVEKYRPGKAVTLKLQGWLALAENKREEATELLYRAYKLSDAELRFDPELAYQLVRLYMVKGLRGELGIARDILIRLDQASPNNPLVLIEMARLQMIQRQYEAAKENLARADRPELPAEKRKELERLQRILADQMAEGSGASPSIDGEIAQADIPSLLQEARRRRLAREDDEAIGIYKAILDQHPDSTLTLAELVQTYQSMGQEDAAWRTLEDGIKANPNSDTLKLLKAMMEAPPDKREEVAIKFIEDNTTGVDRDLKLAMYYQGKRNREKYLVHMEKAVRAEPDTPGVMDRLFADYVLHRELDKAEELVSLARKHGVGDAKGEVFAARLALARRQWEQAAEILKRVLATREQYSKGYALLGEAYRGMGDIDNAKANYTKAYNQNPANVPALVGLAHIAELEGEDYMRWINEAHKYAPTHPYVQGRYLQRRLRDEDPGRLIKEYEDRWRANPSDITSLMVLMGLYERVDPPRLEAAETIRRQLYKLNQGKANSLLYLKQLVDFLRRIGAGKTSAIIVLDQAMAAEKDRVGARILYAQHLMAVDEPEQGHQQLLKALEIAPDDPRTYRALAVWAADRKEADDAVRYIAEYVKRRDNSLVARKVEAEMLLDVDRVDAAGRKLDALLAEEPDNVEFQALRGRAYQRAGETDKAMALYAKVLTADARRYRVRMWRAPILIARGEIEEAIADLREADSYHPSPETAARLAEVLVEHDRLDDAKVVLTKALAVNPRSAKLMLILADVLVRKRDWPDLERLTRQGRQVRPDDPRWAQFEASMLAALGDLQRRADVLGEARRLRPADPNLTLMHVDALLSAERYDDALAVAAESTELKGPDKLRLEAMAARAEIAKGLRDAGLKKFRQLLPRCQGREVGLVGEELRNAVGKQAYVELLKTWAQTDDHWTLWAALAGEYLRNDAYADAREPIRQALRGAAGDSRFHLLRTQGVVERALGNLPAAEKAYREALKLKPADGAVLNNLAFLIAEDLGRPADGLKIAQQAVEALKDTDDICEGYDTLGWVYFLLGRTKDAERELMRSAEIKATAANRYHMGRVMEKLGRPGAALKQYKLGFDMIRTQPNDPSYKPLKARLQSPEQP